MFKKIPQNVQGDSGKCSSRFWKMLLKILGNVQEDSGESKFLFFFMKYCWYLSNFAVNCYDSGKKLLRKFSENKDFIHYYL